MANAKTNRPTARPRFKRLPKGPHGGVELLLVQSVDHLGKQGDVVEVKPGYAHNYLVPQGLATLATKHHKRMVEKHRARLLEIERKRLSGLETLATEIGKQSVTIEANANDEGHLYGSVGAVDIVSAQADRHPHHGRSGPPGGTAEGTGAVHRQGPVAPVGDRRFEGLGRAHRDRRRR